MTRYLFLRHSGIKGQKRGIRRFQYANNTYTPLGNERYRPRKGRHSGAVAKGAAGAVIGGSGLALGAALLNSMKVNAVAVAVQTGNAVANASSLLLSEIPLTIIQTGAAAFAAIPTPVMAVALPIAATYTALAVNDIIDHLSNKRLYK